jgi:hypothetical protein
LENVIIRHLLANAKGRTNKSAKNVFNFFEKKPPKDFVYIITGGVKSRRLNNRLSQFAQDKRQLPVPPPPPMVLSASSTSRRNWWEKMFRNFFKKSRGVDTYRMDENQTKDMTHIEDDGISYYYSFLACEAWA